MKTATLNQVLEGVKAGKLNYYNVYNLDIDYTQFNSLQYYDKYSNIDNIDIDQKLNILTIDIEVYLRNEQITVNDLQKYTQHPINAFTIYSTFEKIYHVFFLVLPIIKNKFKLNEEFIKETENNISTRLKNDKYLNDDETIKIYAFNNELSLLESCWSTIHNIDPSIISG